MINICRILLLIFLFPITVSAQVREIEPVDYKKIRKAIKKKRSPYYYPKLFQRYLELDTSLTTLEFRYLYYGYTFQESYRPYGVPILQDSLVNYLKRDDPAPQELEMAGRIAGELLKESPFRLRETFIAAISFQRAGNEQMNEIYLNFWDKLMKAVLSSGDGLSVETAFSVIYVRDEYEILEIFGFSYAGEQTLLHSGHDVLKVKDNELGIAEVYFDVSRLLEVGSD